MLRLLSGREHARIVPKVVQRVRKRLMEVAVRKERVERSLAMRIAWVWLWRGLVFASVRELGWRSQAGRRLATGA